MIVVQIFDQFDFGIGAFSDLFDHQPVVEMRALYYESATSGAFTRVMELVILT